MKKSIQEKGKSENQFHFTQKKYFLIPCLIFLLLQSCSKVSDWKLAEYDGELNWQEITKKAEWDKRLDHEVAVLNDELYLVGGYNSGVISGDPYYEDVWKSSDGEFWTKVTQAAPFFGRRGHALVTFNDGTGDALFMIGGFSVKEETGERAYNSDVWKSRDGVNWTEVRDSSEWTARMHHKCVIANHGGQDYVYLVGGYTMIADVEGRYGIKYFNDVWRSADGISWESVGVTDFGIRAEHAMTVSENGTIYIQGGQHGVIFEAVDSAGGEPVRHYNDVWQSTDGEIWTHSMDSLIFEAGLFDRTAHEMIFYRDKIWTLPGKTNSLNHYHFTGSNHFPTWTLDENGRFTIDSRGVAIDARHSYASVVWRNQIWVFGGNTNRNGQDNDIWAGSL